MELPLRHKKSSDHSNAPQQKPVLGKKPKNKKMKKINFAQNSFFLFGFQACEVVFCMKVTFRQVCKKSFVFATTSLSLEQKIKMISNKKQRSPK